MQLHCRKLHRSLVGGAGLLEAPASLSRAILPASPAPPSPPPLRRRDNNGGRPAPPRPGPGPAARAAVLGARSWPARSWPRAEARRRGAAVGPGAQAHQRAAGEDAASADPCLA